jgi:hypothetical protein
VSVLRHLSLVASSLPFHLPPLAVAAHRFTDVCRGGWRIARWICRLARSVWRTWASNEPFHYEMLRSSLLWNRLLTFLPFSLASLSSSSIVGRPRHQGVMVGMGQKDSYVG